MKYLYLNIIIYLTFTTSAQTDKMGSVNKKIVETENEIVDQDIGCEILRGMCSWINTLMGISEKCINEKQYNQNIL